VKSWNRTSFNLFVKIVFHLLLLIHV
jgi:hypothetical protein